MFQDAFFIPINGSCLLRDHPVGICFQPKSKTMDRWAQNQKLVTLNSCAWFHFASLGEFEQGRPVLEKLRQQKPELKIVITFFSPSGYKIRKNTPLADYVYYLPLDTRRNAKLFLQAVNPQIAIFTKYEYWYFMMDELYQREIPLYMISAIFRPQQIFFRSYGGFYRKMLLLPTHFFVQDEQSKKLLAEIDITNVTVSGDTRFDRVWQNALLAKPVPVIEKFAGQSKIFIAGSTWPPDENLISELILLYPEWKFIIAPHEIHEAKVEALLAKLPQEKAIRFTKIDQQTDLAQKQVLIIDTIGLLSQIYQYGKIGYVGGGFGVGIHNILEATAFGLPVIFGPAYQKFKEAVDLVELNAAFSVINEASLQSAVAKLITNQYFYEQASAQAKNYTERNTGATDKIMNYINRKHDFKSVN